MRRHSGMTLLELLIVTAIITVLATVGVPTFRGMIQKSKTAEAKTALGMLYRHEQVFFEEFGAYGNNLRALGIEGAFYPSSTAIGPGEVNIAATNPPDTPETLTYYTAGFVTAGLCIPAAGLAPTIASTAGRRINAQNPGYYTTGYVYGVFGRQKGAGLCARTGNPSAITTPLNVWSSSGTLFDRFTAQASGAIRAGVTLAAMGDVKYLDVWTIDQDRNLVHAQEPDKK